jgi:hypothetical protein
MAASSAAIDVGPSEALPSLLLLPLPLLPLLLLLLLGIVLLLPLAPVVLLLLLLLLLAVSDTTWLEMHSRSISSFSSAGCANGMKLVGCIIPSS